MGNTYRRLLCLPHIPSSAGEPIHESIGHKVTDKGNNDDSNPSAEDESKTNNSIAASNKDIQKENTISEPSCGSSTSWNLRFRFKSMIANPQGELTYIKRGRNGETYSQKMGELQFVTFDLEEMHNENKIQHYYFSPTSQNLIDIVNTEPANPRERLKSIQHNLSLLKGGFLPMDDFGTGIYICVNEDDPSFMKALITGPRDTPYNFGLFEFDIYLPPMFPEKPPHVWFKTTNKGRVRFNPNLYANGKVCLSLLGTWMGPSWDPKVGSLHQVLNSIQAHIFVEKPYFNEPGLEETSQKKEGIAYKKAVREATLRHAILDHLEKPSPVFEGVIKEHFKILKDEILQVAEQWVKEAPKTAERHHFRSEICGGKKTDMEHIYRSLKKVLH